MKKKSAAKFPQRSAFHWPAPRPLRVSSPPFSTAKKKGKGKKKRKNEFVLQELTKAVLNGAFYKLECQVLGYSNPAFMFIFWLPLVDFKRLWQIPSRKAWALWITDIVLQLFCAALPAGEDGALLRTSAYCPGEWHPYIPSI